MTYTDSLFQGTEGSLELDRLAGDGSLGLPALLLVHLRPVEPGQVEVLHKFFHTLI
jgi:hypothetical protein